MIVRPCHAQDKNEAPICYDGGLFFQEGLPLAGGAARMSTALPSRFFFIVPIIAPPATSTSKDSYKVAPRTHNVFSHCRNARAVAPVEPLIVRYGFFDVGC